MANQKAVSFTPAAPVTGAGSSSSVDLGEELVRNAARLDVLITAWDGSTGSSALLLTIETSDDDAAWRKVGSLDVRHLNANTRVGVVGLSRYLRVSWTLSVATTVTFKATGHAEVTYCTPDELTRHGVPEAALEEVSFLERLDVCIAASDEADGYLGAAYTLPLAAWGNDLTLHVAKMSVRYLFDRRGWDPGGRDGVIETGFDRAIKWLDRVSNGRLSPPGIVDSTPEEFDGGSVVLSGPKRGW